MIRTLPRSALFQTAMRLYVAAFLIFLFLPLGVVAVFAFNDAPYPSPPWHGFTLHWFTGSEANGPPGLLHDSELLASVWTSFVVALWVTGFSLATGLANAFLMERCEFPGKRVLAVLMLVPLVVPGVILGVSILAFSSRLADLLQSLFNVEPDWLRPGLPLVVAGQCSYIIAIATLIISARLKRFDPTLEEAALNLGASSTAVLRRLLLPWLRPALAGAAAISFLMSFENFNTTLMLVGSDAPLTILMYGRMREGATPVLNAVSLFLMLASAAVALTLLRRSQRPEA